MKFEILCNGWISPFNITDPLGQPRETINVNTRLTAEIDGTPEQLAAISTGVQHGWRPEFWIMREVKE